MTLEELKKRCENAGFQYAYGIFKETVKPPHLVAICTATNNFFADNKVFKRDVPIKMDYTFLEKDLEAEDKIENEILGEIAWEKTDETYLSDENIWQVSYFFNI